MSIKDSIKSSARAEKKKISEIPGFKKKAQYIWDYYRYWIIGIACGIAFCISIGASIYNNIKYTQIFYCAIFNNPLPDEYLTDIETEFSAYYGLDPESETMHFDSTYVIDESDSQTTYMTIQKIGAMIAAKSVDVMLGDEYTLAQYAVDGYYYDFKDIMSEETYNALLPYMVEYTYTEDDISYTGNYLIDLSQSKLVQDGMLYVEEPLAGIVINSQNPLVGVKFIEYIFGL